MTTTTIGQLIHDHHLIMSDGYRTKRTELANSGFRIIRVADLRDGRINFDSPDFVGPELSKVIGFKAGQIGDVLLTTKGTVGRVAQVHDLHESIVYSPQICFFRISTSSLLRSYFQYWLQAPEFTNQARNLMGNTDMAPYINLADMRTLRITIPPTYRQDAVTQVLGGLDAKISANEATATKCRELAATLFTQSHRASLHTGLTRVTIGELAQRRILEVGDGYRTKQTELAETGFRIIRVTDIVNGTVKPAGLDRVANDYAEAIGAKAGRPGDVILTTKGTIGRVALTSELDEQIVYSPQICYFRYSHHFRNNRFYLRYWFGSPEFRTQADHRMNNTDMAPYISLADIRSLRLTVPDLEEMQAISNRLEVLENAAQGTLRENAYLADLRDTLLPHLMSGRLRVKDAEKQVEAVV